MSDAVDEPIVNIWGDLVALGPLSKDLIPTITRWINDLGAQQRIGSPLPGPVAQEAEERWYESVTSQKGGVTFLIRDRKTLEPIGTTGLHDVDFRNRATTFGIMIGDPSARGKGYGTETARLMLDYAFTILGLHSASLTVAGYNLAGQRAYAKAGFRESGRLRDRLWFANRWWDEVYMDCLAAEFRNSVLSEQIAPD